MRILVTGGAGYIGSILTPILLDAGHNVTILDNFMYEQTSLAEYCMSPGFEIIRGDVRNKKLLKELVVKSDLIIPLACIVGAPACDLDPETAKSVNLEAIKTIIANATGNQRIIYPNTNSGYGIGQEGVYCDENSPLNPFSMYGRLKVEAEKNLLEAGNVVVLRLATVFGMSPRMRLDLLVNDFVYRALTDRFIVLFEANFKRNYIHIRDVARAFFHAIENFNAMKGEVYNVGLGDANLSKLELCQEIQKQIPDFYFHEAEIGQDPDKRNYIVSNDKIKKTGFKPQFSLADGIKELIKGCQIIKDSGHGRKFRNA